MDFVVFWKSGQSCVYNECDLRQACLDGGFSPEPISIGVDGHIMPWKLFKEIYNWAISGQGCSFCEPGEYQKI